jgi:translation initiation factor IF-1
MVKNTGGNKSKKVARKNVSSNTTTQDVRKATDASEMYAAVTKIYSSQRCSVLGADGNPYQCTIRGKFLKNKRSGDGLVIGAWVLIGFYEWEVRSDGSKKCDLLEIYSNLEKDKLKQIETRHLAELIKIDVGDCTFSNFHKNEEEADDKPSDANSSDEDDEPIKKVPLPLAQVYAMQVPIKKETAEEQLDWLTISDRDI